MRTRPLAVWDDLRSSYWFIPSLMVSAAVVLSVVAVHLDEAVGAGWSDGAWWLTASSPDGARTLLSTIAGSMIGVAGVTFSVTIASVVYASGQYGPRLLTNFMADRGNQVTLGTFVATFVYGLLVLRTVRAADEQAAGDAVGPFVPHIALATALGLALCSIAVLIYFVHHVPRSIHVSNVIAGVGDELSRTIDVLFPERPTADLPAAAGLADFDGAVAVGATGAGYVQGLDLDALTRFAAEAGLRLRLAVRPGDFVSEGDALAEACPAEAVTDETRGRIRAAVVLGRRRTARQDVRFLVNELVEIAARALSPGVNDPFTAMACLDRLAAGLKRLVGRATPDAVRRDDAGTPRVVAIPTTFDEVAECVYGQLRPYLAADRNAALHALDTMADVGTRAATDAERATMRRHADALLGGAESTLTVEADRVDVRVRHRAAVRRLDVG